MKHDREQSGQLAMEVATMLADHMQIDKIIALMNQNRSAAMGRPAVKLLGGGGGGGVDSTSLRSTNPRP